MKQVICAPTDDWGSATTFGREGQGPAELQASTELGRGADGSVMVSDFGNRRLTWIRPEDGSLIKSHPAPPLFRVTVPEQEGRVIGASVVPSIAFMEGPLSMTLVAVNSETGEEEWSREFVVPEDVRDPEQRMLLSRGWRMPNGSFGAVIGREEVGYWNEDGEFLGTIVSPEYEPRNYTEAEAVAYWESLNRGLGRFGGVTRDSAETVQERMNTVAGRYRTEPVAGPDGTVWFLCNGDKSLGISEFEVFRGPEFLGRVSVPEVVHEFDILGSSLVVLKNRGTTDEFGFEERDLGFFEISLPTGSSG